jgi:hypothetical protein
LDIHKLNIINSQRENLVLDDDSRELIRQSERAKNRVLRTRIVIGVIAFAVLLVVIVSTGQFDFDQFMHIETGVDFTDNTFTQTVLADHHHGFQMVGEFFQGSALLSAQGHCFGHVD